MEYRINWCECEGFGNPERLKLNLHHFFLFEFLDTYFLLLLTVGPIFVLFRPWRCWELRGGGGLYFISFSAPFYEAINDQRFFAFNDSKETHVSDLCSAKFPGHVTQLSHRDNGTRNEEAMKSESLSAAVRQRTKWFYLRKKTIMSIFVKGWC